MKKLLFIFIILLFSILSYANSFIELGGEIKVPFPDGWIVSDSLADYPYQIINKEQSGELLIFKSIISKDEIITNKLDLKASVDQVVEDVILTLPGAKIQTNTGYFDENRVSFILEFTSVDSLSLAVIHHRLKGIIYLHPDGYQLLFTLWAKTNDEAGSLLKEELTFMMEEFAYYGQAENQIFTPSTNNNLITYGLVLIAVIILIGWVVYLFASCGIWIKP